MAMNFSMYDPVRNAISSNRRKVMNCSIYDPAKNVVSWATLRMIPAQRDSFAQRSMILNRKRRQLMKEIQGILRLDNENNALERNRAISGMEQAAHDLSESVFSVRKEYDEARRKVRSFNNRTLRMLIDEYGDGKHVGIIYWMTYFDASQEPLLREMIDYLPILQGTGKVEARRYLMDVRFSMPYEDLSELTGDKRRRTEILLKLSIALHREASLEFHEAINSSGMFTRFASTPIARLAFDYPSRIDEIAQYVGDRKTYPSEVDCGHLREWLQTPSRPLGSGVL